MMYEVRFSVGWIVESDDEESAEALAKELLHDAIDNAEFGIEEVLTVRAKPFSG